MGLKSFLKEKVTTQATGANEFWTTSVPPIAVLAQSEEPTTALENQYELYDALVCPRGYLLQRTLSGSRRRQSRE